MSGLIVRRSGYLIAFVSGALLTVTLTGIGAELDLPWTFGDGAIADAEQVNENFQALRDESNEQNQRIAALEAAILTAGGITNSLIADNAIDSAKIADGTVTSTDIGDLSILDMDIVSLSAGKLIGIVSESQLPQDAIDSSEIENGSIFGVDIAANTIAPGNLQNNVINSAKILNRSVTGLDIASSTITSANIASETIVGSDIAASAVSSSEIANGSITGVDLSGGVFSVLGERIANTFGSSSISEVTLRSTSRSFCFLTGVWTNDLDGGGEFGECRIVSSGGNWILRASAQFGDDNDAECRARCIAW